MAKATLRYQEFRSQHFGYGYATRAIAQ